ncbi:acyl-CoA dehydrogenase family protein [Rhodovulum sp. FJ3]|uniref:acyl-CoA dehydrogenase family protein n=1 Tax=Rhodovulum sp. FJ3 TaxID=3079053 RepID=UPI00293DA6FE|nr:acyl-CoA dehydrogenase family protein [Rhodovulum sp. FJ3]MDV4169212.1 acyl-CoA dehydrogenase family protein [Rhodovulum sp. FJ3]
MALDQSELDLIRASIGKIAERFDLEYWRKMDKAKEYPWDFKDALADGGWLGMLMPEAYGGMGLGLVECGIVLDELGQKCGFNANSVFQYYVFPPGPVIHHGSDEMKKEFLPKLASGSEMMCFGVSEPDNGVDTSRLKTFAKKDGERYLVNGRKVWISNSKNADRILLLTRTAPRDPERPFDGMTLFLTKLKDKAGVDIKRIDKIMRNAVDSNEIVFEDFEVFEHEIVGQEGKGFRCLIDGLNPERIAVAQTCIGLGRGALNLATQYAKDRVVFDRPIGQNQAVAHPLAESWMRLEAADLITQKAARLFDAGQPCGPEANAAKFLASDAGFQAADNAMQFHGGFSMSTEYHVSRFWMEARHLKIAPISQQMVLNFISDKVLGLPRSY